ncbi:hypothetical protein [Tuwongella immobilis]|uniref:DnaT DNA-binding domain-containing protein n=1 Tax=Tuwongella immobilis TaxID=692036 RepID=A0A6C2YP67_9BACT|nr:hypothetical protein [Tuwongella immobilis]VIP02989.1 Uncharacterized protein OS=Klebsiella pneumoniae UCI 17 GN=P820_01635 PE=4 SV=1 [Tuwongella immobilis]VTS03055.1 Uncharacterized protein OS=Klebsiella pneumoniae UCI 17 GN=P820_01635 PE=4 SV=1 [Tuwongella immobilis]
MALDWMPVRLSLTSDMRIQQIAAQLNVTRYHVVGALIDLWTNANLQTMEGVFRYFPRQKLDMVYQLPGFAQALEELGWISFQGNSLKIENFEEHNGKGARRRALENRRKAISREKQRVHKTAQDVFDEADENADTLTDGPHEDGLFAPVVRTDADKNADTCAPHADKNADTCAPHADKNADTCASHADNRGRAAPQEQQQYIQRGRILSVLSSCSEPEQSGPEPTPPAAKPKSVPGLWGKPPIQFDPAQSTWVGITDAIRSSWAVACPAVDIDQELAKSAIWVASIGAKGKKSNYRAFLTKWMLRSQEQSSRKGGHPPRKSLPRPQGDASPISMSRDELRAQFRKISESAPPAPEGGDEWLQ